MNAYQRGRAYIDIWLYVKIAQLFSYRKRKFGDEILNFGSKYCRNRRTILIFHAITCNKIKLYNTNDNIIRGENVFSESLSNVSYGKKDKTS